MAIRLHVVQKHDIKSSTFYSWVNQLKHDGAEVPYRTYAKDYHLDSKPDIVKLKIVDELSAEKTPMVQQLPSNNYAIEITIGQASIKVFNDVNPKLLSQGYDLPGRLPMIGDIS